MTQDEALYEAVRADWRGAALSEREQVLAAHAEKLTRSPASVTRADLDGLRAVGLDDDGIVQLTAIIALFNYLNRMADGLGVGR